jgi:hypothetical protein
MIKPRRMRWVGHVKRMGKKRNAYRILVGKPDGNSPLEDLHAVESMDLTEIRWSGMDSMDVVQDRD